MGTTCISANAKSKNEDEEKIVTIMTSDKDYPVNSILDDTTKIEFEKDELYPGLYDKDGNLSDIDPVKMKNALLERYNKDSQKYEEEINNIDSIVECMVETANSIKNHNMSMLRSSAAMPGEKYYWSESPQITNRKTYTSYGPWNGVDNYRSSVPMNASGASSSTTRIEVGFSGSAEIKEKLNFQATRSEENSTTVSSALGVTVPAWTVWEVRASIDWEADTWEGIYAHYFYDLSRGGWTTELNRKSGVNKICKIKNAQTWSRTNSSHNQSASTPKPSN